MKAKANRSDNFKKVVYYIDEAIVFTATVLAITFKSVILNILHGQLPGHGAFNITWVRVAASSFVAIMLYGALNTSFKYNEKDKPPMFKRIYVSVMVGLAWEDILGRITSQGG